MVRESALGLVVLVVVVGCLFSGNKYQLSIRLKEKNSSKKKTKKLEIRRNILGLVVEVVVGCLFSIETINIGYKR